MSCRLSFTFVFFKFFFFNVHFLYPCHLFSLQTYYTTKKLELLLVFMRVLNCRYQFAFFVPSFHRRIVVLLVREMVKIWLTFVSIFSILGSHNPKPSYIPTFYYQVNAIFPNAFIMTFMRLSKQNDGNDEHFFSFARKEMQTRGEKRKYGRNVMYPTEHGFYFYQCCVVLCRWTLRSKIFHMQYAYCIFRAI